MNLYNLIECSSNYSDTTGTLYQYKRNEQPLNAAGNIDNVTVDNSSSFKYKSNLLKALTTKNVPANDDPDIANTHKLFLNAQIAVPLKYVSSFFRSLEIPFINAKLHFELNWAKDCVMSNVATATTFKTISTKLYVPVVTLPTKENVKLTKQLSKGFKRSIFWND